MEGNTITLMNAQRYKIVGFLMIFIGNLFIPIVLLFFKLTLENAMELDEFLPWLTFLSFGSGLMFVFGFLLVFFGEHEIYSPLKMKLIKAQLSSGDFICKACGHQYAGNFCNNCGTKGT